MAIESKTKTKRTRAAEEDAEFYAIKTGLCLIDENTESGELLTVFMCSGDQNGESWFGDESRVGSDGRVRCQANPALSHGRHKVLSFDEALRAGIIALVTDGDNMEGGVLISLREIRLGHRRLAAKARSQVKARRAS